MKENIGPSVNIPVSHLKRRIYVFFERRVNIIHLSFKGKNKKECYDKDMCVDFKRTFQNIGRHFRIPE